MTKLAARLAVVLSQTEILDQRVSVGLVDAGCQPVLQPAVHTWTIRAFPEVLDGYLFAEDGCHLVARLVWYCSCSQTSLGKCWLAGSLTGNGLARSWVG